MSEPISITLEFTPNPNTLKFVVSTNFLDHGAANFTDASKTSHSPLAKALFAVPGVHGVMVGTNFVTITKSPDGNWDVLAEEVPKTIEKHVASGVATFTPEFYESQKVAAPTGQDAETEKKIREILDTEIRPAVAMDGGDITFGKYEDGVVYLHLQGACSSCPSSIATLKMGVENRLKEAIPSIKEVVQV